MKKFNKKHSTIQESNNVMKAKKTLAEKFCLKIIKLPISLQKQTKFSLRSLKLGYKISF